MSGISCHDLGSMRELFVDDFFISQLSCNVTRQLHQPVPGDVVMTLDEPHEQTNNSGCYNSIVYDGKRYLLYYRAKGRTPTPQNPQGVDDFVLCVAETTDGIHFRRSQVNLFQSGYNVVLDSTKTRHLVPEGLNDICAANSCVFYDTTPSCPDSERFKMVVTNERPPASDERGMYLFVSADGFDFHQKTGKFQLSAGSGYDSANRAFYDPSIGQYRLYHRAFKMAGPDWKRTIMTHLTKDFQTFTDGKLLEFDAEFESYFAQGQELYTNNIQPYFRAPHILLGFPMRYVEGSMTPGLYATEADWNERVLARPDLENRFFRAKLSPRYGLCSTDTVLIASRDGEHFRGWGDSFLAPPPQDNSWYYSAGTVAAGMIPSPSKLGHGAPDELSFYAAEGGWSEGCVQIRRYYLRMDGFVSLHFGCNGGVYRSPKFRFDGGRLALNIATGAFGGFRAVFLDEAGTPIPGYTLEDSYELCGDSLSMAARWKGQGADLRQLCGTPVQLEIHGRNCDLYSLCFEDYQPDLELPSLVSVNKADDIQKPN